MKQEHGEVIVKWFEIVLEEYNSLRNEISDSLKNQQSVINYGLASIGVLIGFTADMWKESVITEIIFVFFIPFISHFIMLIWNGEVNRMSRAGQYIKSLEDKINEQGKAYFPIKEPALYWESFLRESKKEGKKLKNKKKNRNYLAIIGMFWLLSYMGIAIGIYHNFIITNLNVTAWLEELSIIYITGIILFIIIDTLGFIYHYQYYRRVKK